MRYLNEMMMILKDTNLFPYYFSRVNEAITLHPNGIFVDNARFGNPISIINDIGPDFYWKKGKLYVVTDVFDLEQCTMSIKDIPKDDCLYYEHLSEDFDVKSKIVRLKGDIIEKFFEKRDIDLLQYCSFSK